MRKRLRNIMVVVLALVIMIGIVASAPICVSAATAAESVGASSGTTGDCTWTLSDNGTLTIGGGKN